MVYQSVFLEKGNVTLWDNTVILTQWRFTKLWSHQSELQVTVQGTYITPKPQSMRKRNRFCWNRKIEVLSEESCWPYM